MTRTVEQYKEYVQQLLVNKGHMAEYPSTPLEWCVYYQVMDEHFGTLIDSPLHHDNNCKICK